MDFNISDDKKTIYSALAVIGLGLVLWGWFGQSPQPTRYTPPPAINLLAMGDINLGRQTGQEILKGDNDYAFEYLNERISAYDIAFGNLESQLVDLNGETQSPTNEYRFAGPPAGADGLKESGFDIVSIANNHMWDYGKDALFSTIDNLDRVGVKHVGASQDPATVYQPTIIDVKQQQVAFVAATNLLNGYERSGATEYVAWADADKLIATIEQVKDQVDWVIVSLHWGSEYVARPSQAQVELGHKLIDAGADVIIGSHSHVPQGVEEYNDGIIFYSLGNFAFWQPFDYWTQHSFMAEITLLPSTGMVEYNPVAVKAGWQPRLAADQDNVKILQYIAKLSDAFIKK
ncbi:CapA family protein [Patescibacteria group bacterium]|nr:CapA family protein [Patescibacteria group bacterium]